MGVQPDRELLKQFDKDNNGRLNKEERKAAQEFVAANPGGGRGFGRGFGRGGNQTPPTPNGKLTPAAVKKYGKESLYDEKVLRTIFIDFEDADWEQQMAAFYRSDVLVAAKMTVDGKVYPEIGVSFRGNSSYMGVSAGFKRSLHLNVDFADSKTDLLGYKTLNLLNGHEDASFIHGVLLSHISQDYIPALKANFMRVVINGETWGIYVNQQHFNGDFLKEAFPSNSKGTRWKVPGSPGGSRGGLGYLGEDIATYKTAYELKSKDDPKAWASLQNLTKVLSQTPAEQLPKALENLLDVDSVLKYLAVDKALINGDGYWTRGSDYNIFLDEKGKFHILNHDLNEALNVAMGPGGGGGVNLDPFAGTNDSNKALYNLLKVPAWRAKYLSTLKNVAEKWLDWNRLGPLAKSYHDLIAADVKVDNRKLETNAGFDASLDADEVPEGNGMFGGGPGGGRGGFGGGRGLSLKKFADQRRAYLLAHPEITGSVI